jgi:uncharacterized protein YegP (UPF0339 family)
MYRFEVYEDEAREFRWRLVAPNGRTVADSGEAYARKADAIRAAENVAMHAPIAAIETP